MEYLKNKTIEKWIIMENKPMFKKLESIYTTLAFYSFPILMIILKLSTR